MEEARGEDGGGAAPSGSSRDVDQEEEAALKDEKDEDGDREGNDESDQSYICSSDSCLTTFV